MTRKSENPEDHVHYYRDHGDGWATCDCGAIPEDWE